MKLVLTKDEFEDIFPAGKLIKHCNRYSYLNTDGSRLYVKYIRETGERNDVYTVNRLFDNANNIHLIIADNTQEEIQFIDRLIQEEQQSSVLSNSMFRRNNVELDESLVSSLIKRKRDQ